MTSDRSFGTRLTIIIVATDLLFNAAGLLGYNEMRKAGMARSAADRAAIAAKLDAAWVQRERLAAETERACRR